MDLALKDIRRHLGKFLATIAGERITHTFMVPAQFLMVLAQPDFDSFDTSGLQSLLCAGSPLRRDTKREVLQRFGNKLIELYGFSEGFGAMLKPDQHDHRFDSVGRPVLGCEVCILDDAGKVLPPGEVGEIAGYGAGMMARYHRRDEQTAALIWRDARGRSWIRSGDVGKLDAEGYITLVDRKKDMIISGGFNVFPTDIEAIVGGHPDVLDVTVIGIPHEKVGRDGAGPGHSEGRRHAGCRGHRRLGERAPGPPPAAGGGGVPRRVPAQCAGQGPEAHPARTLLGWHWKKHLTWHTPCMT